MLRLKQVGLVFCCQVLVGLTEHLAEYSIVQVRVLQCQPLPLILCPDHKCVHGPANPLLSRRSFPITGFGRHASTLDHIRTLSPRACWWTHPGICPPHVLRSESISRTAVSGVVLLKTHFWVRGRTWTLWRPGASERHPAGMQGSLSAQSGLC